MRHSAFARSILGWALCSALWLSRMQATAQVTSPSATPPLSSEANVAQFLWQQDQRQQELRTRLADPVQRAQLIAERIPEHRKSYPDLARVLGIDAATEQQLLALLVEATLADELRSFDPLQAQAREYDRHMLAVGKLLSPIGVDSYLDYQRTRPARLRAQQIDQTFPHHSN